MKDRLPHLKAIVQYTKTISEREEGIELMEVRGGREGRGKRGGREEWEVRV